MPASCKRDSEFALVISYFRDHNLDKYANPVLQVPDKQGMIVLLTLE